MARTKKDNFPIKLRQKPTTKGYSLYLEYNANGKTVKRYLGLHLLNGTTARIKAYNANIIEQAKAEQAKAILDVTNRTGKPLAKAKRMTLQDVLTELINEKNRTGKATKTVAVWRALAFRINDFCEGKKIQLKNVDVQLIEDFIIKLKGSKKNVNAHGIRTIDRKLTNSTIALYISHFSSLLKYACTKGYLNANPFDKLSNDYKVTPERSTRTYLTLDELKRIEGAICHNLEVKRAFLFSCYTGLRCSDIKTLNVSDIVTVNGNLIIRKVMQKTGETVEIPLNSKAIAYLGSPNGKGLYFDLPQNPCVINKNVHRLGTNANIDKDVCFHVARHTFATTLLTLGGDLYTTSKLLGHSNISTTQIYAEIVEEKKRNAMALFDNL